MDVYRQQLPGAAAVSFAMRGFDGERVTRDIAEVHAPGSAPAGEVQVMAVHFEPGQRTSRHVHTGGQILVVLEGTAEVVTDDARVVAGPGDVVVAAPEEWHWHGAFGEAAMTHLAIHARVGGPGRETT